jgi:hypothetical protein
MSSKSHVRLIISYLIVLSLIGAAWLSDDNALAQETRDNSNKPSCVEWRKKCSSNTTDPAKVASALQKGARTVIDLLATLPKTDRAILNCSAVATGQVIATASACQSGNCIVDNTADAFNQGAKAACAINDCLESFVNNPAVKAMSLTCNAGDQLAAAITCNGYPGGGGGLKG